ncbi:MAG: sugar phosphate isomerase/epimerase family protein, partial [Gemmataceae bacterium]
PGAISPGARGEAIHLPTVTTDHQGLTRLLHSMPAKTGINYDPGNIKAAEGSKAHLHLALLNKRVNYCHLKDWKRQGQGWVACAVGDDDLDYGSLIRQMDFEGVYLIEYEPLHDPEDGIRRSLQNLKSAGIELAMEF